MHHQVHLLCYLDPLRATPCPSGLRLDALPQLFLFSRPINGRAKCSSTGDPDCIALHLVPIPKGSIFGLIKAVISYSP